MKHEPIQLTIRTANPTEVTGFKTHCPFLAVTPMMGGNGYFHITHIPTGAKLDRGLKFREAFKIAAAIGSVMDWSGDESECAVKFYELPQQLQRWARSF